MLIWICGPSGSGKTTTGQALYQRLKTGMPNLFLLDGDEFRSAMGNDLGYSAEERKKNGYRATKLCQLLDSQDINVIYCGATIHPEIQELNRSAFTEYIEVLIEISMETLVKRDPKGIYARALAGKMSNVLGMDIEFLPPSDPHVVLNNDLETTDFSHFVDAIISRFQNAPDVSVTVPGVRNIQFPEVFNTGISRKAADPNRRTLGRGSR